MTDLPLNSTMWALRSMISKWAGKPTTNSVLRLPPAVFTKARERAVRSNRSVPAILRDVRRVFRGDGIDGPELVQLGLPDAGEIRRCAYRRLRQRRGGDAYNVLSQRLDGVQPARRLERDAAFGVNDRKRAVRL